MGLEMSRVLRVSSLPLAGYLATCIGISVLLISPALAQVNDSGPSPSSSFDNVLNLPGDEALLIGVIFQSVFEDLAGQTIQLNVSDGGEVGSRFATFPGLEVNVSGGTVDLFFEALSGSEVNISGGTVGRCFEALSGSEVNISGGVIDSGFRAESGSEVNISGGTFGPRFRAESGSDVELIGGEFRLNGADFTDSTISLADDDIFTGTFADGSTFFFGPRADTLTDVTLTVAPLPAADLNPIVISSPIFSGPFGLRTGQTLTLVDGGFLEENFVVVDALSLIHI